MKRLASLLLLGLTLLGATPARAERWAILVGNNAGHGVDVPLRFAESDAARVSHTLAELGGFDRSRIRLLASPDANAVERAFRELASAIAQAKDDHALVVFYYSGHADGATLHLGDSSLDLYRVRDLLAETGGSVRIGILDACGAGAIIARPKGLERSPPFMMATPSELSQKGQVLIAAVSASEAAQESDALHGSFFTNFLVAGLRGAADRTGIGRVTLDDAYRYAYAQTVRATMLSQAGAQHPTYSVDLSGQGDLVLTEPGRGRARLTFQSESRGTVAVFTPTDELVAELAVSSGGKVLLALPPGEYEVRKRAPGGLRVSHVRLTDGQETVVAEGGMTSRDFVRLARKGFAPRLRASIGYLGNLRYPQYGDGIGRVAVDLAKGGLLITPRLSVIGGGQSTRYPTPSNFFCRDYEESFSCQRELGITVGLGISRSFELRRFSFAIGGAFDFGWLGLWGFPLEATWSTTPLGQVDDRLWSDAVFSFSATASLGVRLSQRALLFLDVDAGLWIVRQPLPRTLAPDPYASLLTGVRVEL